MPGRPVPGAAVRRPRLRGRARRPLAVERRRDPVPGRASRTSRSASRAAAPGRDPPDRPRPGRSAPPAAGVRIWSLYVPNGRTLERPALSYKLDWLAALRTTAAGWLADDPSAQVALVGDWNIAPGERRRLGHDRLRPLHPRLPARAGGVPRRRGRRVRRRRPARTRPGPGVYTYWDYTQLRFPRREGMRIDFVLGSPALAARVTGALHRPRGAQGQGRQRPRPGDRRAGGLTSVLVLLPPVGDQAPRWRRRPARPRRPERSRADVGAHRARRGAGQAGRRPARRPRGARALAEAGRRDRAQRRALDQPHPAGARSATPASSTTPSTSRSLTRAQRARAGRSGSPSGRRCSAWSAADDRIPAYRLSAGSALPGLPTLRSLWKPALSPVLAAIDDLVVDLRSGSYAALAPVPGAVTAAGAERAAGRIARGGQPLQQGAQGPGGPAAGLVDRRNRPTSCGCGDC